MWKIHAPPGFRKKPSYVKFSELAELLWPGDFARFAMTIRSIVRHCGVLGFDLCDLDFSEANFDTLRLRSRHLGHRFEIFADRVLNILKSFFGGFALRVTARQRRAIDAVTLVSVQENHLVCHATPP